jgi:hypothetical protein
LLRRVAPRNDTVNSKEETMAQQYDRKAEDLGNITGLEHVNLQIPDQ